MLQNGIRATGSNTEPVWARLNTKAKIAELKLRECLQCGCHIFPGKSVRRLPVILVNLSSGVKIPNFNL
jgi:hypothetical protein